MNTKNKEEYRKLVLSPFFKAGMLKVLPMGTIAGLKITELDDLQCKVTVPYKYINKNPFNTTYWAVLGMAAEMASGALVQMYTHKSNPSVSMFVTGCNGKFLKRAVGVTTFICNDGQLIADTIQKAIDTKEAQTIKSNVKGYDKDQVLLVDFDFEWSLKARSKK
mgnify:FL=1